MHKPKCDFCGKEAKYDGKVRGGGWAHMCEHCFRGKGVKLKGAYTTLDNIGKPGRKPYSD